MITPKPFQVSWHRIQRMNNPCVISLLETHPDICNFLKVLIPNSQIVGIFSGRSSSLVGYGIGIAEAVGSNPTRSMYLLPR